MTLRLENKIAVITGGNNGIGLATAKEFAAQGARVVIMARSKEKAIKAIAEIGHGAIALTGDVTSMSSIKNFYAEVSARLGKIDILFANAGIVGFTPLDATDESLFDAISNTNFKGVYFTVSYAVPHLNQGASVVLTSSIANEIGIEELGVYSATKAAVRSLARSFTPALAKINARINVLSPGPVHTGILEAAGVARDLSETMVSGLASAGSAGRVGKVEEMAKVALFLASQDSSYMYGSEIQVDGGINQTRFA